VTSARRIVRLSGVALLLFCSAISGCRNARRVPDGVLIIGQQAEPRSLDPHVSTASTDFRIAANIYEGLVRFREGALEIEPALAESWQISEDGLTYTFTLVEGVKFHDGTPFNAEAVRFNFERLLNEEHSYHDTGPFPLAFFFSRIDEIETPDDRIVIFRLEEPFAPLLSNLASPSGFLVSPSAIGKFGKEYGRHPVGTGPFIFEKWESNRLVEVRRNPDYREGAPKLETVIFRPLTDENARLTELLSGGCDVILEVAPDIVTFFRKSDEFKVLETEGPHLWFLILNTREGPFRDVLMRRAANLAINRKALVHDLLQDTATVPSGPIPRAFKDAAAPGLKPYPYNPDAARKLVEASAYSGEPITLYATEGGSGMLAPKQMAAAIQADLAAIGLDVQIETFEWNTYLARVNEGLQGKADMAEMAWMVNDPDTLPFLALRTDASPEKGGFNSGYYSNPEVDKLIEKARETSDLTERDAIYQKIDRIVYDDAPWVFTASWKQNAVTSNNVHGLELQPSFLLLLKDAWKGAKNPR
jgi:peptide/nickel transport system substrate-binding protein